MPLSLNKCAKPTNDNPADPADLRHPIFRWQIGGSVAFNSFSKTIRTDKTEPENREDRTGDQKNRRPEEQEMAGDSRMTRYQG